MYGALKIIALHLYYTMEECHLFYSKLLTYYMLQENSGYEQVPSRLLIFKNQQQSEKLP